jgi:hypothetical protein
MRAKDTSAIEARLRSLSLADLGRLAEFALGEAGWAPGAWSYQRLHRTFGTASGGIFRVSADAERPGETRPWSVILKVVSPAAWIAMTAGQPEQVSHPLYWKREVLAFQSGWLGRLPGGLRGPRWLAAEPQPDGSVWLWLEDVHDYYSGNWPLEQYARAAYCLGRFNGAFLAGEAWPDFPWLARSVEPRGVIEAFKWIEPLVRNPATWDHPLLRQAFTPALVARLPDLWDRRHVLLEALERLPKTICHQDAWPGNLFSPTGADGDIVLIDWAYVGISVVGTDLGDLAVAGYPLLNTPPDPADIDRGVFEPYLAGLCEAGWTAPRERVRFAYITYAVLKYGCLLIWLRDIGDPEGQAFWEQFAGQPLPRWLEKQAAMLEHQLRLLDEACGLLPLL